MAAVKRSGKKDVVNIGSRLEPFVDDWLIDRLKGLELRLHSPVARDRAIVFDRPWGGLGCYVTVFRDDDRCRMYYSAGPGSVVPIPEIAFAWLIGVSATDRYVYTGDSINRRMLRLRIAYAAEKTCALP